MVKIISMNLPKDAMKVFDRTFLKLLFNIIASKTKTFPKMVIALTILQNTDKPNL